MKEHFLNYEQSIEVRDLAFNHPCIAVIGQIQSLHIKGTKRPPRGAMVYDEINCPLKSQFFKWVRERHGIDVHTSKNGEKAINLGGKKYVFFIETTSGVNPSNTIFEDTYEQAEDACINKIIELLKLK